MSGVDPKVHSFTYFTENVLPKIEEQGYNVIQIMGVLEHPYYGSFGYHVSSFFSVSYASIGCTPSYMAASST